MAAPDKSKKIVNQNGYDGDTKPFTDNYQDLYRGMLVKHRLLYEMVDEVVHLLDQINQIRINDVKMTPELEEMFDILKEINEVIRPEENDE